jgi:hypothetical protein
MTVVGTELRAVTKKLAEGNLPDRTRLKKHVSVVEALNRVASEMSLEAVIPALQAIERIPERVLYRRELWREMERSIERHLRDPERRLRDAAWKTRDRARRAGRTVDHRTVSRTLLIKGLEFDHAIVLNAGDHDAKNLYVAMTRGSRSLTVLSSEPRLRLSPAR